MNQESQKETGTRRPKTALVEKLPIPPPVAIKPKVSFVLRDIADRLIEPSDLGFAHDERRCRCEIGTAIEAFRVLPPYHYGIHFEPVDASSGLFLSAGAEFKDLWNDFPLHEFEDPEAAERFRCEISPGDMMAILPTYVMPLGRRVLIWTLHVEAAFLHHLRASSANVLYPWPDNMSDREVDFTSPPLRP